jgi:hypothetical protein
MNGFKAVECVTELPQMTGALNAAARLARRHDGRNQDRKQDRKHCDGNYKFQHRETGSPRLT